MQRIMATLFSVIFPFNQAFPLHYSKLDESALPCPALSLSFALLPDQITAFLQLHSKPFCHITPAPL